MRSLAEESRPELAARGERVSGLDVARFVACMAVVFMHSGGLSHSFLGRFRMPYFTVMLAYLVTVGVMRKGERTLATFAGHRAYRVLLPFVLWVGVYQLPSLRHGTLSASPTPHNMIMGMHADPLWYLPFAFFASVVAFVIARAVARVEGGRRGAVLGLMMAAGAALSIVELPLHSGNMWARWHPLFGAILLGVGTALAMREQWVKAAAGRVWPVWVGLWIGFAYWSSWDNVAWANFLGVMSGLFLLLAGLTAPLPKWPAVWKYLGQLSYGIYLTHWGATIFVDKVGMTGMALRFGVVTVVAVASTVILQETRWGRFMLGMEGGGVWRGRERVRVTEAVV